MRNLNPLSLYLPTAIGLGLFFCFLIPPNCVPDESHHYLRAEAVSRGQLWPLQLKEWGGGELPQGVIDFAGSLEEVKVRGRFYSREDILFLSSRTDEGEAKVVSFQTGGSIYTFLPYLPAAIVLAASRLVGIKPYYRFYLGRITNLIVSSVLTYLAMQLLPGAAWPIFLIGTLSITLQQFASFSADALLLSVFFLSLSLVIQGKRYSIVALSALAWIKFPYVTIAAALLPTRLRRWLWIPLIFAGISWALSRHYIPAAHAAPGYPVSPEAQLLVVVKNPIWFLEVVVRTLWVDTLFWFKTLFTLGYLNVYAGDIAKYGWSLILILSVFSARCEISLAVRRWLFVGVAIGFVIILFSQYLMWTEVRGPIVRGPQGRYFIPILLCCAIPLGRPLIRVNELNVARACLFAVALVNVTSMLAALRAYWGLAI